MIKAGDLRHIITIQTPTAAQNNAGEVLSTFVDGDPIHAKVSPVSAKERLANEQITEEITHKVQLRYLDGVDSNCRVNFGGRIFEVDSVINPEERNIELMLLCFEQGKGTATS